MGSEQQLEAPLLSGPRFSAEITPGLPCTDQQHFAHSSLWVKGTNRSGVSREVMVVSEGVECRFACRVSNPLRIRFEFDPNKSTGAFSIILKLRD